MAPNCQLVLLAAGEGKRFNSDKRWAKMPNGEPVWLATLSIYARLGLRGVIVVRQAETPKFLPMLPNGFELLENEHAELGMESSRAAGLATVQAERAMIALADMPFVKPDTIRELLSFASDAPIVCPSMDGGRLGHPKIFHRSVFKGLSACLSAEATKAWMRANAFQTSTLDVRDRGIFRDIDRVGDLPTD